MRFKELGRDADEETIKTAYRRLAKFYHPDGWFIHFSEFS
jgi:curved DNA-binding protein CbpA